MREDQQGPHAGARRGGGSRRLLPCVPAACASTCPRVEHTRMPAPRLSLPPRPRLHFDVPAGAAAAGSGSSSGGGQGGSSSSGGGGSRGAAAASPGGAAAPAVLGYPCLPFDLLCCATPVSYLSKPNSVLRKCLMRPGGGGRQRGACAAACGSMSCPTLANAVGPCPCLDRSRPLIPSPGCGATWCRSRASSWPRCCLRCRWHRFAHMQQSACRPLAGQTRPPAGRGAAALLAGDSPEEPRCPASTDRCLEAFYNAAGPSPTPFPAAARSAPAPPPQTAAALGCSTCRRTA